MRSLFVGAIGLGAIVLGVGAYEDGILTFSEMLLLVAVPAGIEAWSKERIAKMERDTAREIAVLRYTQEAEDDE